MCERLEKLTVYVIVVMERYGLLKFVYLNCNGRHIKRAINHLYPLEVADENLKFKEVTSKMNYDSDNSFIQHAGHIKETNHKKLPMRQAAITARQRVNQLLKENALTVLFTIT